MSIDTLMVSVFVPITQNTNRVNNQLFKLIYNRAAKVNIFC